MLFLYGAGLAAIAAGNYQALASILTLPKVKNENGKESAICTEVYPLAVMENALAQLLPGLDRRYTPVSDYLFDKLRTPLREYIPRDEDYQAKFDRFEYLLGLVHADLARDEYDDSWWGPVGCFKWRTYFYNNESGVIYKIGKELETEGINWAPLKAGLFGGSVDQAKTAKAKFDAFLSKIHFHYAWFVYRFYPVAKHHAYICLEFALRQRFEAELLAAGDKKREFGPGLKQLLEYAIKNGYLKNEDFELWRRHTEQRARRRTENEILEEAMLLGLNEIRIDDIQYEIKDEDRDHEYVESLIKSLPWLRNSYAHGSTSLGNQVLGTIRLVAEIINKIY